MINECLSQSKPFGVVLIKRGRPVGAAAEPHLIGCSAQIAQVQPLTDGRMNLVAIGQERFRIHSLDDDRPYLCGMVELLPLETHDRPVIRPVAHRLRIVLTKYLEELAKVGEIDFDTESLPEDCLELAFLAATLLQAPIDDKQALLEINTATKFVKETYATCRREIAVLRAMLSPEMQTQAGPGPFSVN